ncbi:bifunctional helix-turn-helix transcriptional regulator/GNAT family N-acetyltransferase [Leucothrix arctica]|uniref:MarR family transcriptional regulator n=1 Tax=Leucothrix arctica TaxID=1481894 RepID=A0A317CH76_9GAMM|nr:helix-turn-helix domain-containing GNAT family N-acetyltransferase [Leucothrix arctica]PWQ96753.1 MarR family transcriptional regulator [Leucothrix arctica]
MSFYSVAGQMALGSRLRQLGDVLMNDAEKVYGLYDVDIDPRWFPVFYMLTIKESAAITELASDVGHSHAAVSQVVKSMMQRGVVTTEKCPNDARVNRVMLTEKGKAITANLEDQCLDVNAAVTNLLNESGPNLWAELDVVEKELKGQGLFERVVKARKARKRGEIELVPYLSQYEAAFRDLNIAWIEKYWTLEAADYKALDKPTESIINQGGYIVVALYNDVPVGVCALIKMKSGGYELAKMAVDEAMKGLGVGTLLGQHVIDKAKSLGANSLYLESNTVLAPALGLYQKLGFQPVANSDSPYKRCNVQMVLNIKG